MGARSCLSIQGGRAVVVPEFEFPLTCCAAALIIIAPLTLPAQILVAQKVAAGVYKGVTTSELDELAAETAAALTSTHPDYATVGQLLQEGLLPPNAGSMPRPAIS